MKVKKVGATLLAGALLTMGGVYAAWTYGATSSGYTQKNLDVSLTDVSTTNSRGALTIEITDETKAFTVDQADADFNAKLVCSSFTFKFTPTANSDSKDKGTPARVSFRFNNYGSYDATDDEEDNPTPIFKMDNITHAAGSAAGVEHDYFSFVINPVGETTNYKGLDGDVNPDVSTEEKEVYTWTPQADGSFTFTLSKDIVAQHIVLNNNIQLKNYEEYSAFVEALKSVDIQLRIVDLQPSADIPVVAQS